MSVVHTLYPPTEQGNTIAVLQSPASRAINVGYLQKKPAGLEFIPGRLTFGAVRAAFTYQSTLESLQLPAVEKLLKRYQHEEISTITVMRETLACSIQQALAAVGITQYYGDAFIGATHIKGQGEIKTAYLYENAEGLTPTGLWIVLDSLCVGRNLRATLESLLAKYTPKELLFIAPIASRRAINLIDSLVAPKHIPTHFVTWGGLFGVAEANLYDMPWGHKDTEPLDRRDQQLFVRMFGPKLCMGGDFGNNYYGPVLARQLYEAQLKEHAITPDFPTAAEVQQIYANEEVLINS